MSRLYISELPDCLGEIFEHINDDVATLYSCLLVNRLWCRLIIPILWRNPLKFTSGKSDATYQVIQTYISCLFDSKKGQIFTKTEIPKLLFHNKPLFNYSKYLQEFNNKEFEKGIRTWRNVLEQYNSIVDANGGTEREIYLMELCEYENLEMQCDFVYDILIESLFNHSKGLRIVRILHDPVDGCKWTGINRIVETNNLLFSLQKFIFCYNCKEINSNISEISNLFTTMSKYVHRLQHLYIDINERFIFNELFPLVGSISTLIESQNSLKNLIINEFWDYLNGDLIKKALLKQSPSLIYLEINEFSDYNLLLQILTFCKNLEILRFGHQIPQKHDLSNYFTSLSSNNLLIKHFYSLMDNYNSDITLTTIELILKMSNKSLQTLSLSKITSDLVTTISNYCSQLTRLSFIFHTREIKSICSLLSSLPSLKHLILIHYDLNQPTNHFLFHKLAKSIPNSLNHFGFDFELSPKLLEMFLSCCPNSIEILTFHGTKWYREDYLSDIVKYVRKKRGGLKELRIEKFRQCEEDFLPQFVLNALKDAKKIIPVVKDSNSAFTPFFDK